MAKALSIVGAILGWISIPLPWWTAASNLGISISLSLASLESLARGVTLRPGVTLGLRPEFVGAVQLAVALVVIGGILALAGGIISKRVLEVLGGLAILGALISFVSGLVQLAGGTWILGGGFNVLGLSISWGLSYGALVAGIAEFMILASAGRRK